jgi:hypothetical protein
MTIYYHLSTNLKHDGVFEPRIPDIRHQQQEDTTIGRISVAPTIEDCLTAIPNGGGRLEELNIMQRGYYLIFTVDTEKLGISEDQIITSEVLYEKDLVRDAEMTNEVWITTPFTIPEEDSFMIRLVEWNEEPHDVFPHSIHAIAEEKYDGDPFEAYEETYNEHVPCSIVIKDATYFHEVAEEGQEIELYYDYEEELEELKNYLQDNYEVEITDESIDTLTFTGSKANNFRKLFLYHSVIVDL